MPLLSLKNLSKSFDKTPAVAGVSLDVERGEFFGLLGPSGCGKTTTLRMIAGLEQPDAGSIVFADNDVTNLPAERRGFGMVFQNYALFPHLNVFENVAFGLRARHTANPEIKERVKDALEMVQLRDYDKRRVDELSGGQQQRVAIARAIAIEPALLLFDEPLSNLDVTLREETRGELRELVTRLGLTAVYVTHDQEEAFALCDRISVMVRGCIQQTGRPRDLYEHPARLAVATFLGRNNLIRALRHRDFKFGEFRTIDGDHMIRLPFDDRNVSPRHEPCFLAIRPEHVLIRNGGENEANAFPAVVREINFSGATSTVKLDANGLLLEVLTLDADGLRVGDERTIVLPAKRISLLNNK